MYSGYWLGGRRLATLGAWMKFVRLICLGLGDLGDYQSCDQPGEGGISEVYGGVGAGEAPPVPIGEISDYAGRETSYR
jgi:hypothetical protein